MKLRKPKNAKARLKARVGAYEETMKRLLGSKRAGMQHEPGSQNPKKG